MYTKQKIFSACTTILCNENIIIIIIIIIIKFI
jgi:hypothetical protein